MNRLEESIEYLAYHKEGSEEELREKVGEDNIAILVRSGFLQIEGEKYKFTNEGVDYYAGNVYKEGRRKDGLFGILTRFHLVFD